MAANGPLLIGIGGLGVEIASGLPEPYRTSVLMLDTDRRSIKWSRGSEFRLVGAEIAGGEGSGGNLNIARACFRKDMEELAGAFLARSPIILVSSTGGATGLAGSAEIGGLLIRTDRPAFSVLVRGELERGLMDTQHITEVMLDGPLRPGCLVSMEYGNEGTGPFLPVSSRIGLSSFLGAMVGVFSRDAPLPMDISALQALRKEGGTHRVLCFEAKGIDEVPSLPHNHDGTELVLVGADRRMNVDRMRRLTGRLTDGHGDVHIGFYNLEGAGGSVRGFMVRGSAKGAGEHQDAPGAKLPRGSLGPDEPELSTSKLMENGLSPIHR